LHFAFHIFVTFGFFSNQLSLLVGKETFSFQYSLQIVKETISLFQKNRLNGFSQILLKESLIESTEALKKIFESVSFLCNSIIDPFFYFILFYFIFIRKMF
jgi:hypothetical protein